MNRTRDPKTGRFTKSLSMEVETPRKFVSDDELYDQMYARGDEQPIRIVPSVRFAVWFSHNRLAVGYVILCLLAGGIGGYLGAHIGLR